MSRTIRKSKNFDERKLEIVPDGKQSKLLKFKSANKKGKNKLRQKELSQIYEDNYYKEHTQFD